MKRTTLTVVSAFVALGLFLLVNGCNKQGGGGMTSSVSSAEKNSFKEVASHLDAGGNLYVYLSTEQFLGGLSEKVSGWRQFIVSNPGISAEDSAGVNKAFDIATKLIHDSGVEDVSGFGMSSIATDRKSV